MSRSNDSVPLGPDSVVPMSLDPAPPAELHSAAVRCFGDRLPLAARYAALLATDGVVRGLLGPRESERLWDRHLLNCAVVGELVPTNTRVVDVGSGAGLPGVALAIARPDLTVVLIEPMARRATFLSEVVAALDLDRVTVIRARAEDCARGRNRLEPADIVTARAVAPLDRLAAWCLPLVAAGGRLLALKGESAVDEVATHRAAILRSGGAEPLIKRCGVGVVPAPTTVVEVSRR